MKRVFEGRLRFRELDGREDILVGDTNLSTMLWCWEGREVVKITVEAAKKCIEGLENELSEHLGKIEAFDSGLRGCMSGEARDAWAKRGGERR